MPHRGHADTATRRPEGGFKCCGIVKVGDRLASWMPSSTWEIASGAELTGRAQALPSWTSTTGAALSITAGRGSTTHADGDRRPGMAGWSDAGVGLMRCVSSACGEHKRCRAKARG